MGNRAAAIRAAILAAHPEAAVEARGANWIRHVLPNGKRSLDVSSSLLHYDGDQEIDTSVEDSDDGNFDDRVVKTPYRLYQRNGDRRIYPRRNVLTEYIELGRPEFRRPNGTYGVIPWDSKTRQDNVIAFHRSDARLEVIVTPTRLKMNLVLLSAPTVTRWRFPISIVGLTRQGANLIAASDGATVARLAPFTLEDANGVTRDVPGTLNGHPTYQGAYIVEPDLSGLAYPVVIDPTIDVAVAANADDGRWTAATFDATATSMTFGNDGTGASSNAFMRFDGITVPNAATIDVAYIALKAGFTNSQATCHAIISAEDADDPAAVTSVADANGRTITTATAAWSSIAAWTAGDTIQTPSLVSVVQEIVDRGGWASGNAMQFFIKDNSSSTNARRSPATLENATHAEPTLHIEYTADTTIAAALLGPTSTLYGATLSATGSATISAAFLGPTSTLYGATVAAGGDATLAAAIIPSGATLYGADIALTYELAAAFLSSGATLYGATVAAAGDAPIDAAFIPSGATLYGASVAEVFEIAAAFLSSGAVLYGASFRQTAQPAVWIPRRRSFRVVIYAPLPSTERIDLFDLNPDITSLRYRTGVPGGFTTLEVGYPDDNLPRQGVLLRRAVAPPRARVQLWEGAFLAHEGLIESGSGPGALFGISSTGYGLAGLVDSYIASSDATASTAGEILRQVIGSAAPTLRTGASQEWRDSGIAHTLGEMNYRTPQAIIEQLTREGGIANLGNRVWDWTVYEDRRARFLPRDTPANPRYLIPLEGPPWLEWNENYVNMYSSAAVLYTVAGVETLTATATTEGFVQRWGFERTALLTMGETTAAAAATYRDTWLAMHAEPEYSIVVTRTDDRGLEMPGGAMYPAHLVRAGEADGWVQIGTGMPNDPVLPIIGTEYDAATRTARYELGTPNVFDIAENLAEVCRETSNLSRWIHPNSGTRMRT